MPIAAIALSICSVSNAASARIVCTSSAIRIFLCRSRGSLHPGGRPIFFLAQGFLLGAFLRQPVVALLVLAQYCCRPGLALFHQVEVVLLGLLQGFWRLGLALQARLLRHRPCPCLPKGPLRLPCLREAPFLLGVEKNLLRFCWTHRVRGWALRVFSSLTASALLPPGWVSVVRAAFCWWSPSFRLAFSSSRQLTRKNVHISCCSKRCALACDREGSFQHGARVVFLSKTSNSGWQAEHVPFTKKCVVHRRLQAICLISPECRFRPPRPKWSQLKTDALVDQNLSTSLSAMSFAACLATPSFMDKYAFVASCSLETEVTPAFAALH